MSTAAVPLPNTVRQFSLRVVLTITTGRLLTKPRGDHDNGIGDLYDALYYMTGERPFTHQLNRFMEECARWIFRWYPRLRELNARLVDLDARHEQYAQDGVERWLGEQEAYFGESLELGRIPADDHDSIPAYDELVAIRGTEGIVLLDEDGSIR